MVWLGVGHPNIATNTYLKRLLTYPLPLRPPSLRSHSPRFPLCGRTTPLPNQRTAAKKVTWTVDDQEGSDSTLFHVDLYDCGDDQTCGGACGAGEFVQGLCPEEGCYSTVSIASVSLLEVSYVLRWSDAGRESAAGGGGYRWGSR